MYSARSNYVNGLSTLDSGLKEQLNSRYRKETSKALGVASNIDYQNSEVTKNVASDNFDGSNVDIETISAEKNKAVEIEKNVSLVQDLANIPGNKETEKSSDSSQILNIIPTKRDNVTIQDINENNVDNILMTKAAENANTPAQPPLNLPSLNSNKNSETSQRDSFDLTTPTIPFVY